MRRAVGERVIGNKPICDVVLPFTDDVAEFEGKRCRYGNGGRDIFVVVHHLGDNAGSREDAADHIGGVVAADAADDRVQVARLPVEIRLGKVGQVHPHRGRQASKQQYDKEEEKQADLAAEQVLHGRRSVRCDGILRRVDTQWKYSVVASCIWHFSDMGRRPSYVRYQG